MKKKLVNLLLFLSIIMFSSCNTTTSLTTTSSTSTTNKNIAYTITIIKNKINETDEIQINNKNTFSLSDLPDYQDEDYIFLGYSLDNDDFYLNSNTNYPINENLTLYAQFGSPKDVFKIDSIGKIEIFSNYAITTKEEYVNATLTASDDSYEISNKNIKIRLRGNSSLGVPKKSYKIKFDKKEDFFGFKEHKEWALIANYFDPSHLRNYYAYKLAKAMEIEYHINCKFVNVFLNNEPIGLYLLCETVETNTNRVDIEKDYIENEIEIPFMLELDYKLEENDPNYMDTIDDVFFLLDNSKYNNKVYQFATKSPDSFKDITTEQYNYIKTYMHNVYNSVRDKTYEKYIDVNSFIDYFIVQELFMNIDQDYSSVFMYKPYNEKLHMGPLWDFDLSSGNCSYVSNYDPYHQMKEVNGGNYLFVTLMEDPIFREKFITRLKELNEYIIPNMIESFDYNYNIIKNYAKHDNNIWNNLNEPNWARPNNLLNLTHKEQVNFLKNYLSEHYYWMYNYM